MVTVNLASNADWSGDFVLQGTGVTNLVVNGGPGAAFHNTHSELLSLGNARIDADVLGIGSFDLKFHNRLAFGGGVGADQIVNDQGGELVIGRPSAFLGTVNVVNPSDVDIVGLTEATSFSHMNDILSIYAGDTVINKLHLRAAQPDMVVQIRKSLSGLDVLCGPLGSMPSTEPMALPLHP